MISGGAHRSMTDPPKTAMFNHCGEVSNKRGLTVKEERVDAVQQLACAIATPNAGKSTNLDSRSKCNQQ